MPALRLPSILKRPVAALILVGLVYLAGVALRVNYTLRVQPPATTVYSDMSMYVDLAKRLKSSSEPLGPWDVTHPLGFPAMLAFLMGKDGSLVRPTIVGLIVACLVPLAVGLLGWAAFGRRTALLAVAFSSLYFPFIEFGAHMLSEIHFIFWMTLAFAAFFAARDVHRRGVVLALSAAGGFALSLAIAFKSVALLGALAFFAVDALALFVGGARGDRLSVARLRPWLARAGASAVAAAPLLGVLARVCTRANEGRFCVTGNKMGADFLLGHYGRIADMSWAADRGHGFVFGSPSTWLRHLEGRVPVPFPMTDNAANTAEAWRWIRRNPFEAFVLSLDHVYDTFFGQTIWPTMNGPRWAWAQLSEYVFIVLLFIPAVLVCAHVVKQGARAALASRVALVFAPVAALAVTVAIATGEVRYRVPFDVLFIAAACALVTREVDGSPAPRVAASAPQT
ncbi:MAG TPA: phospholipid carrier-dependent glycosyltransferase [Polyangia bacterium]|nr:phospholipid carrier-dependent glycosyltransferase [Polyangia bacterium]